MKHPAEAGMSSRGEIVTVVPESKVFLSPCMYVDPIVERILLAYKKRKKGLPVRNKDTDRVVYVQPETLKERSTDFESVPHDEVGDPRYRGKPKPPARPEKPHKPEIPRDPPPSPLQYPPIPKQVKPSKPVKPVPPVKPPKVPEPSKKPKYERRKNWLASDEDHGIVEAIVRRFLG